MNSAAKLRNRRVIATAAATALVVTAFGPAAMAWDYVDGKTPGTGASTASEAGAASIGIIDADRREAGTNGATAVSPGANNQPIGDVRFVFPGTWAATDKITFKLDSGGTAVTYASLPTVNIDEKAYGPETHIATVSTSTAAGSVETGDETAYEGTGTPVKPEYKTSIAGDTLTVEFTNTSSSTARTAKFIGAINGAKVNVPAVAAQDISMKMDVTDSTGPSTGSMVKDSGGVADGTDPINLVKDTTYVAGISNGSLSVENGAVVADGQSSQYVGPITANTPSAGTAAVEVTVAGATFDTNVRPKIEAFDAAGKAVTAPAIATFTNTSITTDPKTSGVVRIVISGAAIQAPTTSKEVVYTLTQTGAAALTPTRANAGFLGTGTTYTQTDIVAPTGGGQVRIRTNPASSNRLGGVDRYDTAARLAASQLGTIGNLVKGEVKTVVIASGENYADALSAGYVTATQKAALILTQKGQLSYAAENFLRTYGAEKVIIVGGDAAVSKQVEDRLRDLTAYDVQVATTTQEVSQDVYDVVVGANSTRIGGSTGDTATLASAIDEKATPANADDLVISVEYGAGSVISTIALKGGTSTAWNLTGTTTGAATGTATVSLKADPTVTRTVNFVATSTSSSADFTFAATTSNKRTVTKQEPVSSNSGMTDATATGDDRKVVATSSKLEVIRIGGANRFVTNRNVNEWALRNAETLVGTTNPEFGKAAKRTAVIANGLTPWDALASGPLVGSYANGAKTAPKPIILTMGDSLEGQAKGQLGSLGIQHAILVGGNAVLPEGLAKELQDNFSVSSSRLAGANRWETAKAVGDFLLKSASGSTRNVNPGFGFDNHNPYLANGGVVDGAPNPNKWADALAIGPVAASSNRVVTLTDSAKLPEATEKFFTEQATALDAVIPVGGVDVVSNAVVAAANAIVLAK